MNEGDSIEINKSSVNMECSKMIKNVHTRSTQDSELFKKYFKMFTDKTCSVISSDLDLNKSFLLSLFWNYFQFKSRSDEMRENTLSIKIWF